MHTVNGEQTTSVEKTSYMTAPKNVEQKHESVHSKDSEAKTVAAVSAKPTQNSQKTGSTLNPPATTNPVGSTPTAAGPVAKVTAATGQNKGTPRSSRKMSAITRPPLSDRPKSRKTSTFEAPGAKLTRQRELIQTQDKTPSNSNNTKTAAGGDKRAGAATGASTQSNTVTSQGDGMAAVNEIIAEGGEGEEGGQATEGTSGVDERVLPVLRGSLKELPSLPSRIVRIFTSSTFTGKNCNFLQLLLDLLPVHVQAGNIASHLVLLALTLASD